MHTSADGKQTVWQIVIQLHTKLYGSKEELKKRVTFVLQTGPSV